MKGLRIGTSPADLTPSSTGKAANQVILLDITETSDLLTDLPVKSLAGDEAKKQEHATSQSPLRPPTRQAASTSPSHGLQLHAGNSGLTDSVDDEADLFAIPMTPRSPETARNPFRVR